MKNILLSICLLMGVAGVQAQLHSQERVVTDTLESRVLGVKRAYTVVLPRSYWQQPERKYPVLYLLHGMWDKNDAWAQKGRALEVLDRLTAAGDACEMILVTPDAGGGNPEIYQNGYFDMPGWPYETFFFTELLPSIESRYRIEGSRHYRAVAGLSMGGGGATAYGQRHPDLFCAVYAMSALMDIPEEGAARFDNPDGKLAKLTRAVIDHSCVKHVATASEEQRRRLRTVRWMVDCGDDDFLLDRNLEFFRAMRHAGIPCQLRVHDGSHDWEYWHAALQACLPFVTRAFGNDPLLHR